KFQNSKTEPLTKLLNGLRYMVNKLSEDIDMAKVFLVELRQSNKALNFIAPKIQKDYEKLIKKLLDEAKDQGLLNENIDTQVISISTFGLIETMLFDWLNRGYSKEKLIDNMEKTARYFVNGIRNI
ncbi:MAG TPA: TetR/AcrR family transcriptional regulator C-terminal domain-containing protein, partial [Candidatus Mcinerneyibacterium sp.]|nr:TetR/AcrR family transcriptional regulator C-terminal domain-containing protein [Candidatus Mcinerneyibacterium sp.]